MKLSAEYTFNVENSTIGGITYRGTNLYQFYMLLNHAEYTFNVENSTIGGITYRGTNTHQFYMLLNQLSFKGWGMVINAVYEPTFRTFGYTYHSVYTVNLQMYKTFLDGRAQGGPVR